MITGFGSVLKDYLEYHNISQVEFAESLDITPKHLNEILNKNIDMSEELMVAISLITDIDISLIINMENEKKMKIYLNQEYGDNLSNFLKQFNINELSKKHWVEFKNKDDTYRLALDLLAFLKVRNFKAMDNILANIMYSANSSDICMTMVDGNILYKDGIYTTIDIEKVIFNANRIRDEKLRILNKR